MAIPAGYGRIRYTAELAMTPDEAISLFAELSLGLAGFAGVGSAFAGRNREFHPIERSRLVSVVWIAASVLAGSLAYVSVSFMNEPVSLRASAATSMVVMAGAVIILIPPLVRSASGSNARAEKWVLPVSAGLAIASVPMYAFITWNPTSFGFLAATFSMQLLHSLWLFVRLLTRAN